MYAAGLDVDVQPRQLRDGALFRFQICSRLFVRIVRTRKQGSLRKALIDVQVVGGGPRALVPDVDVRPDQLRHKEKGTLCLVDTVHAEALVGGEQLQRALNLPDRTPVCELHAVKPVCELHAVKPVCELHTVKPVCEKARLRSSTIDIVARKSSMAHLGQGLYAPSQCPKQL